MSMEDIVKDIANRIADEENQKLTDMFSLYGIDLEFAKEHRDDFEIIVLNDGSEKTYTYKGRPLFKQTHKMIEEECNNSPFGTKYRTRFIVEYIDLTNGEYAKCLF